MLGADVFGADVFHVIVFSADVFGAVSFSLDALLYKSISSTLIRLWLNFTWGVKAAFSLSYNSFVNLSCSSSCELSSSSYFQFAARKIMQGCLPLRANAMSRSLCS